MSNLKLSVVKTEMLIRRPVTEVFEAFVNPGSNDEILVYEEYREAAAQTCYSMVLGNVRRLDECHCSCC